LPPDSVGPAAANATSPPAPKLVSSLASEVANTGSEAAPRAPAVASSAEATTAVPARVLPVAPASVTAPSMSPVVVAVLISRGDALLSTGDITAARLMYGRAADAQSVAGALAMGMTFEPKMLAQIGVQGLPADTQRAEIWYQRAAALGSSDAVRLLRRLRGEDAK
jgi:TPR repeat protein